MKTSILSLLFLVVLVLGSTLILHADENVFNKMWDHMSYHRKGVDLFKAGQYSKALYFLDKAIQIYPSDPFSYAVRGKVYLKLKQYNKAWDDVKKVQSMEVIVFDGGKGQRKPYEVDPVFLKELRKASGREE